MGEAVRAAEDMGDGREGGGAGRGCEDKGERAETGTEVQGGREQAH